MHDDEYDACRASRLPDINVVRSGISVAESGAAGHSSSSHEGRLTPRPSDSDAEGVRRQPSSTQ